MLDKELPVKKEIERRFLLKNTPDFIDFSKLEKIEIKQWYISVQPVLRLRSENNSKFILCIKTKGSLKTTGGIPETEVNLSEEEFYNLYFNKVENKRPLRKTRYLYPLNDVFVAEIDFLKDDYKNVNFVEVEFKTIEEASSFVPPFWFGEEITGKNIFSNASLYFKMNSEIIYSEYDNFDLLIEHQNSTKLCSFSHHIRGISKTYPEIINRGEKIIPDIISYLKRNNSGMSIVILLEDILKTSPYNPTKTNKGYDLYDVEECKKAWIEWGEKNLVIQ